MIGGDTKTDVPFQWLSILFEENESRLKQIHDEYRSGKMLSGEMKMILIEKINAFLVKHRENKKKAEKEIESFMHSGKLAKEMWTKTYE